MYLMRQTRWRILTIVVAKAVLCRATKGELGYDGSIPWVLPPMRYKTNVFFTFPGLVTQETLQLLLTIVLQGNHNSTEFSVLDA